MPLDSVEAGAYIYWPQIYIYGTCLYEISGFKK